MKISTTKLTREDFSAQFLRWAIVTNQNFIINDQTKTLRMFQCLDSYIKLSCASTIKNHIMKRLKEVELNLFKDFSNMIKISFTLDCWFVFNRQSYLFIIVFFIDKDWKYHEILIDFEYMNEKHIEETLTKVVEKILIKHNIQARILAITIDNASNNIIFFFLLVKNLSIITNCVDVVIENENEDDEKTMN